MLTRVGIPGLVPLPWWQMLTIFGYAMVACLVVNDAIKVAMIRWRVPESVAGNWRATPDLFCRAPPERSDNALAGEDKEKLVKS